MRRLFSLIFSVFLLAAVTLPVVAAAAGPFDGATGSGTAGNSGPWCQIDKTNPGVLISGTVTQGSLPCYVDTLLKENMPYVLLVAVLLVVVSGIQYMTAQGVAAEQAKAKTRILGILAGVIFYFLIQFILPLLSGGVTL